MTARTMRAVRSVIGWVLLGVLFLLALLTVGIPGMLGLHTYTVLTGSMTPALAPGALIGVKPVEIDAVVPGDVVTFQIRSGDPTVATHRVVGLVAGTNGRMLITQGDANDTIDALPVQAEQLVGVVRYAVPYLGYVHLWGSPATKAIVTTAAGVVLILWGVVKLVRPRWRRRSALRQGTRASAVVLVGGLIGGLALLGGSVPNSAFANEDSVSIGEESSEPRLFVSLDGTAWSGSVPLEFAHGQGHWVPGDTATAVIYVHNASTVDADLALEVHWEHVARPGQAVRFDVSDAFRASVRGVLLVPDGFTNLGQLQAGETTEVPIEVTFAPEVGDREFTNETIAFSADVRLTERTAEEAVEADAGVGDDGLRVSRTEGATSQSVLEMTGASHGLWAIGGLGLIVLGAGALAFRGISTRCERSREREL